MEIRLRDTGQVVTEKQFRSMYPNISMPKILSEEILNELNADVVFEGPQAQNLEWWQYSMRSGVIQINGKWYTNYIAGPSFSTQEEQDAYIAQKTQEREESLFKTVQENTQERLDAFARTRNYSGILSACTYATSTVPKFQVEGQYCVEVRDATWAKLYEILAEIQANVRPLPTGYEEIEPELPELIWPPL